MASCFRRLVRRKANSLAGLEIRCASSFGRRWALIVSDIVVVAFIEAKPGGRSPYGQLPETAPSFVEAPPRSEAPPAETGTGPSSRVGALPDRRRAARFHGGPRAHGVRRNLHRAPSTVLATLAPDILKGIGGVLGFAATLGYLMYRKGRYTGYPSGAISERATGRNRSEGRVTVVNPAASAETALNPPPPPEMPPQSPGQ